MSPDAWNAYVKALARDQGFDRCGVAPARAVDRATYLRAWLDAGRAGSMHYLHRYVDQRSDPRALLPGARSLVVTALSYHQHVEEPIDRSGAANDPPGRHGGRGGADRPRPDDGPPRGRVAMYAWGDDYHPVIRRKLHRMADAIRAGSTPAARTRVCVDTAPLLEREFAALAGVGWIGKNTLALNAAMGSCFFLGAIITTLDIAPDPPAVDHCGTCRRCLEACPTRAFPKPYEMDASRCIAYLTIEHRGDIPETFHESMGSWVFGCDVCQEVCPHNHGAPTTREASFAPRPPGPTPRLDELLRWDADDYRRILKGSALKRAKLDMLQRNARIALANERAGREPRGVR